MRTPLPELDGQPCSYCCEPAIKVIHGTKRHPLPPRHPYCHEHSERYEREHVETVPKPQLAAEAAKGTPSGNNHATESDTRGLRSGTDRAGREPLLGTRRPGIRAAPPAREDARLLHSD